MSQILNAAIAVIGVDIGKNSFHIVSHDERGAIVCVRDDRVVRSGPLCQYAAVPDRLGSLVGAHHLSRKLRASGRALGRHRGKSRLECLEKMRTSVSETSGSRRRPPKRSQLDTEAASRASPPIGRFPECPRDGRTDTAWAKHHGQRLLAPR